MDATLPQWCDYSGKGGMEESAFLECREEIQLTPNKLFLRAVNRGFSSWTHFRIQPFSEK